MQSNYTFLTDHSYSIRLDYDKLQNKKRRRTSNRSNKTKPSNRTVSIDRSSSDKENTSSSPKSLIKKKTTRSRVQSENKPTKINVKSTQGSIIKKKTAKSYLIDTSDVSIEERVKLRRTKQFSTPVLSKKSPVKRIHHSSKGKKTIIKSKKFFLGSGLDLDNIVLGNRQRRSVQT